MRWIFFTILLFSCLTSFAQSESTLRFVRNYPIAAGDIWSIDVLGNIYLFNKDQLKKLDSTGAIKFQQSVKLFGDITSLYPINTMKLALFSEQQQLLCFLDNTLTQGDACLDLNQFQLDNVSLVSASVQPDKFWLYEGINGRLVKVSLNKMTQLDEQKQETVNLNGIIGSNAILRIKEVDNVLCLLSDANELFLLDQFGSLISKLENVSNVFDVQEDLLVYMENGKLFLRSMRQSRQIVNTNIELETVHEIRFSGKYIYVKYVDKISKYELLFAN